jgi:hypothetical protein
MEKEVKMISEIPNEYKKLIFLTVFFSSRKRKYMAGLDC